jgi:hypothetical protein
VWGLNELQEMPDLGLNQLQEMPDLIGLTALDSLTISGAAEGNRRDAGAEAPHTWGVP